MNKNSSIVIIGGVIVAITIIVGLYGFQEKEAEKDSDEEIEIAGYDPTDATMDKKLEEVKNAKDGNYFQPAPGEWIRSGPFEIDRLKYRLGDKVFLRVGELHPDEKGQIAFLKQTNDTHYTVFQTIPFDGQSKAAFNYYTDIKLSVPLQLCTLDDVLGEWTVVFRGTDHPNIKFEVTNEFVPGQEGRFESVC